METIVSIRDISYHYPTAEDATALYAVEHVTLDLKQGEFTAIIGHNGSGKSTLAKLINGLILPVEGTVNVCGWDTADESHLWDIRQSAGMVFQNPDNQLVATIVEEDVAFGPENLGVPREEIVTRVRESLEAVGMTEYAGHAPHLLSGGQKQRVAIAGILAIRPKILIMDESTAMLDPSGRREVMQAAMKLNREKGMTVIAITHYMQEAVEADRIIVMDAGHVVMDGTPKEVFSRVEELRSIGLEVPPMVELGHQLRMGGMDIPVDALTEQELVEAVWQSM